MPTLLVIDDEPAILKLLGAALREDYRKICTAGSAAEALAVAERYPPDAVVLDLYLPDGEGLDLLPHLRARSPHVRAIAITGKGNARTAHAAFACGVDDYLTKPLKLTLLCDRVRQALAPAARPVDGENWIPAAPEAQAAALGGVSDVQIEALSALFRGARNGLSVLILGESGTGKELAARAVHEYSGRSGPFVALNCGAVQETLLESELFGHEKGAFTGADRRRAGAFEQAHGGTLFLDEVGDMPLRVQVALLRVLQEQRFRRVGGSEEIATDARVVAATNQDLQRRSEEGRFRPELFHRLNEWTVVLPPLRDRAGDVRALGQDILAEWSRKHEWPGYAVLPEVWAALESYRWPGNVRELRSALAVAAVQARGSVITVDCLSSQVRGERVAPVAASAATDAAEEPVVRSYLEWALVNFQGALLTEGVKPIIRAMVKTIMEQTDGNRTEAARLLNVSRPTLRKYLKEFGLDESGEGAAHS